ncbi:carbohydrate ABC transporter membrane protein 1, CUT1 family [Gracilibacillus ureilyticus]|uniref:Carbohydrate ABC transporter membrane protein 1, CUT1 family n=1 Tax=Gracilibacillus ureilyticus TaxID=531814 RepID=A0A1H9TYN9_9BACI|nr:sugar ABC transporter permease [Gracilibacillus ureilyticus]SES02229.1 carbohydrate ABC transporter membrane protein 1, CUT1 family [Gracilibacillus ureilyticus]
MENSQRIPKKKALVTSKSKLKPNVMEKFIPYLFILPAMSFLVIFVLLPLLMSFFLSLTDWNLISSSFSWKGFDNYIRLFTDKTFWQVVGNTLIYGFISVTITVILATLLATMLDKKIRGINFLKGLIFLPYITPMVAVSVVWIWMFDQHFGLINWFLGLFGIDQVPWLTQSGWAMAAIIIMKIWKVVGYYTIILIAGLQNIPNDFYEAARTDGANERQIFFKITLPLLSPSLLFVMIVAIIASFQDFDQIYMMTQGGPADSTNMLIYYLYQFGFQFFEAGYASSVAVMLFITLFFITWLQTHFSKKWVHY